MISPSPSSYNKIQLQAALPIEWGEDSTPASPTFPHPLKYFARKVCGISLHYVSKVK